MTSPPMRTCYVFGCILPRIARKAQPIPVDATKVWARDSHKNVQNSQKTFVFLVPFCGYPWPKNQNTKPDYCGRRRTRGRSSVSVWSACRGWTSNREAAEEFCRVGAG